MNLIGVHIKTSSRWPIKIEKQIPSAILFNTCNRYQYLCEPQHRDEVFECFEKLDVRPIEYVNRDCVRKMTEMSFGLDSVNLGSTIVRKQMLEAKNNSGTRFLKNVVTTIVDASEVMVPYPGYRQFTAAKHFLHMIGFKRVHIITGGEIVAGGRDCFNHWDPNAFECDACILAGSVVRISDDVVPEDCKYCINFSFRCKPPKCLTDITDLFDSYISSGGPLITDVRPLADLIWSKIEGDIMKKKFVADLKNIGVSSNEIEHIFNKYDLQGNKNSLV